MTEEVIELADTYLSHRRLPREVNTRLRIPVPTIVTPEDFFGEEE